MVLNTGSKAIIWCRVRAVEVPCVLNIAAVKLKSKEYDDAIHECNKILEIEVSNSCRTI